MDGHGAVCTHTTKFHSRLGLTFLWLLLYMIRVPPHLGTMFHDVPVPRFGTKFPEQGTCPCSRTLAAKVRTLASIVLISSHPSLSYPEATVRTCVAGQSRNLWNVGGRGLGILGLGRLSLDSFFRVGVGRDGIWRPTDTSMRRLVSEGSGAASLGRNRPDITFQGAPFEARRVGIRNGMAVPV